jgi:hypothetical protein
VIRARHQMVFKEWLDNLKKQAEIEILQPVSG